MRTKLSFAIDAMFTIIVSFILSLVILTYYIPYPYTIIISLSVSILSALLFYLLSKKKDDSKKLKRSEKTACENVILNLNYMQNGAQTEFFYNAVKMANLTPEKKRNSIFIKEKNLLIIPRFSFSPIGKAEIAKAHNLSSENVRTKILAESFTDDEIAFSKRFFQNLDLVDGKKVYLKLKEINFFPPLKFKAFPLKKKKFNFNFGEKKKAKKFLAFGLFFLLSSRFVPIKIYYLVIGVLFLIASLFVRLFGKSEIKD